MGKGVGFSLFFIGVVVFLFSCKKKKEILLQEEKERGFTYQEVVFEEKGFSSLFQVYAVYPEKIYLREPFAFSLKIYAQVGGENLEVRFLPPPGIDQIVGRKVFFRKYFYQGEGFSYAHTLISRREGEISLSGEIRASLEGKEVSSFFKVPLKVLPKRNF